MDVDETMEETFVPLVPGKRKSLGMMVSSALPGILLILSVFGTSPGIVGEYLFNGFCLVSGILLIYFSVRAYKFPSVRMKPGIDTVMVFSGLILIAQGAQVFYAVKGFQPAHLYFLAGGIFIFKGVMFPESKIKKGFLITESGVIYRKSVFRNPVTLSKENLADIFVDENSIKFQYHQGLIETISLQGFSNLDEVASALRRALL